MNVYVMHIRLKEIVLLTLTAGLAMAVTDLEMRKVAWMVSENFHQGMRIVQGMLNTNITEFSRLLEIANDAHGRGRTLVINGRGATNPCPERNDTVNYNVRALFEDLPEHIRAAVRPLANANLRHGQSMQQAMENACDEILHLFPEWVQEELQEEFLRNPERMNGIIREMDEDDRQKGRTPRSELPGYADSIREPSPVICTIVRNGETILRTDSPEAMGAILQPGDIIRHPNGQEIQVLQQSGSMVTAAAPREITINMAESQQETSFTSTPHTIDESSVEPFTGTPHRLDNFDLEEMD